MRIETHWLADGKEKIEERERPGGWSCGVVGVAGKAVPLLSPRRSRRPDSRIVAAANGITVLLLFWTPRTSHSAGTSR
jgi:hypothetical protein